MRCAAPETHGAVSMSRLAWMAAQAALIGWLTYSALIERPREPMFVIVVFLVSVVFAAFLTALLTRCWDLLRLTALKGLARIPGEDRKADGKRLGTSPAVGLLRETGEQTDRTRVSQ